MPFLNIVPLSGLVPESGKRGNSIRPIDEKVLM
jgi:hypothetical protein